MGQEGGKTQAAGPFLPHPCGPARARSAPGRPGTGRGEPGAPHNKTPKGRERQRGRAGGNRGLGPFGALPSPPPQEHHLARYHPGLPPTCGIGPTISSSTAFLFQSPVPRPGPSIARCRESCWGWAATGDLARGEQHQQQPVTLWSREHGGRQSLKGYGLYSLLTPSSFGLRQRERAEETGLLLLTSELRQRAPAGNEGGGAGRRRAP